MNAKLIAAVFATLIAASAHAEQKFGRDSVYAGKTTTVAAKSTVAQQPTRFGRDSVYVGNSAAPSRSVKVVGDVTYKFGRS